MEKRNKKRKKFPKKIIAASLLAIVLIINFVYSSLENVEAKGMFAAVEAKAKDASEGKDTIKLLEILPDSQSLGMLGMLIKGEEPFKDVIKDYSDEQVEEFAKMLSKYGIVNMDSTTSAVYPLTYYKPGEQSTLVKTVPELTDEEVGYGLSEQNLVTGYFQEVSAKELDKEKVYYQEIIVTATPIPSETPIPTTQATATPSPSPSPTEATEVTGTPVPSAVVTATEAPTPTVAENAPTVTPVPTVEVTAVPTEDAQETPEPTSIENVSLHKEYRDSVMVAQAEIKTDEQKNADTAEQTEGAQGTPTPEPSAEATAVPTEGIAQPQLPLSEIYFDENGTKVYLNYNEEGLNHSTQEGRFFRFISEEEYNQLPVEELDSLYKGVGYEFVFTSKAEIRNNDLFKKCVLGITDETQLQNVDIELKTCSVDVLSQEVSDLGDYDLVYMTQPIFKAEVSEDGNKKIQEWEYANPDISEEDKKAQFSPWVTIAETQNANIDTVAKMIASSAINSTDPLKLVVDTSIIEEYERAYTFYSENAAKLTTGNVTEGLAELAATAEENAEIIKNNGIYKVLLMLAQDDFIAAITSVCTVENQAYVVDDDLWNEEGLTDGLIKNISDETAIFRTSNGHYVNENIYFYKHNKADYNKALCDVDAVSMLNGDFRSIFKKSILAARFSDVVNAIDHENETNAYFESNREQINAEEISTDMVLQYLLNYTGQAVEIKKNHISVLEIEPCADFSYDYGTDGKMTDTQRKFIQKWMNDFAYTAEERAQGKSTKTYDDVDFTCMSMQEFIGKNEDLNATYDMIYIGSNIGKFKTSDGVRQFNDTSMTGLVYTHIGDTTGREAKKDAGLGLLDRDYTSADRTAFSGSSTVMRTTGNDLTTYKKRDLLNFLASGYPVIAAEDLFTYEADGTTRKPAAINAAGAEQGGVTDTSDTRIVYVRKPTSWTGWDSLYMHMYQQNGSAKTTWPGKALKYLEKSGKYYVYTVNVPKTYDTVIVNRNKTGEGDNKATLGNKDVYTLTLNSYGDVKVTEGAPSGVGNNDVTVDNSTYLYQLLKIATANSQNKDNVLKNVTRTTLNSDSIINTLTFDWDDRMFPNLLTDGMSDAEAHVTAPKYLNETKVYLNLTKRPNAYNYTEDSSKTGNPIDEESINYLKADSNGRYHLEYEFSISTLAGTLSTSDYDCQLFVDANFDGKFSPNSEILDSVIIKEAATGQVVTKAEGEEVYHLKENTAYTLSRKLPKSFDGCINWKLQVSQNGNDKIVASEIGYCAIPVTPKRQNGSVDTESKKQKIKILQITSGTETTEYNKRHTYNGTHVNMEYQKNYGSGAWHELLSNIPDFELEITTISAAGTNGFADRCLAYDNSHTTDKGGYALHAGTNGETNVNGSGYDMLVIGFIDVFSDVDGGKSARAVAMAEAINKFGESGRSILFTHDTTSWTGNYLHIADSSSDEQRNSAYLSVAIRDLCGNDQYGLVTRTTDSVNMSDYKTYISQFFKNSTGTATKATATGKNYSMTDTAAWSELLSLGKDIAFKPNSNQTEVVGETQGSTYTNLRNYNVSWSNTGYASDDYVQYTDGLIRKGAGNSSLFAKYDDSEQFEIGQINEGAITEYPYILPDSFEVNATHAQYWTVDIESDNNGDNESDLVVWYCINKRTKAATTAGSDGPIPVNDFYKDSPNDVRNNYYIYNKGNITYSGAGHSPISNVNEIKLFINTMIAAYNAQIKVPEISIVESGEPEAPDIDNIIIPYDTSVSSADVDFVDFGTGENGTDGQMKIYFNVYDGNLTARDKNIKIDSIFISDSTGTDTMEDANGTIFNGRRYTAESTMKIYDATNGQEAGYEKLISGRTYYILAPIGDIFKTDQSIQLYVQMHTEIGSGTNLQKTPNASDSVTISRAEIFDLD